MSETSNPAAVPHCKWAEQVAEKPQQQDCTAQKRGTPGSAAMAEYKVEVKTGDQPGAGTWDHILVTIIGDAGESERTNLDNFGRDFKSGKVSGALHVVGFASPNVFLNSCVSS